MVKAVNRVRRQLEREAPPPAAPPPEDVMLLREIRDELKRR
jgi:large conductance mechanosensitive channel